MKNSDRRRRIAQSIKDHGFNVTVSEVSHSTGLPVALVNREIDRLASVEKGFVDICSNGQVVYRFPPQFDGQSNVPSVAERISTLTKFCFQSMKTILSIVLISSVVTVITAVVSIGMVVSFLLSPFMFAEEKARIKLHWLETLAELPRSSKKDHGSGKTVAAKQPTAATELLPAPCSTEDEQTAPTEPSQSFLNQCSAYFFGEANPNENISERQMELIGKLIAKKRGALIREELDPYLYKVDADDDDLIPILAAFNGVAELTESGNTVYVFPSMAADANHSATQSSLPAYLEETLLKFSGTTRGAVANLVALTAANCIGSWYLRCFIALFYPIAEILLVVNTLLVISLVYLIVPALRFLFVKVINKQICERNAARAAYCSILTSPPTELASKLKEVDDYRRALRTPETQRIIYTTEKDLLEQELTTLLNKR